jgi:glycerol dehydrogenase
MSQIKVFGSPEKYVQGPNVTAHLGEEMAKLGMKGPVVIVASPTPRRLLGSLWEKSLADAGYEYSCIEFGSVCTSNEVDKIANHVKNANAKTMVAFGGGQVIDAVRAASIITICEVVSCPTVASTDAPCSTLCAMYNRDHSFKECLRTKRHPTLVLVDTVAVAQAPSRMLVGGLG